MKTELANTYHVVSVGKYFGDASTDVFADSAILGKNQI